MNIQVKLKWLFLGLVVAVATISQVQADYQDVVLADHPQYYWTFDDGSTNAFNKGNGTGGTLEACASAARTASTTNAAGLSLGQAASFSGIEYQAWVADDTHGSKLEVETPYESYAIEYWTNLDTGFGYQTYLINASGLAGGVWDTPSVIFGFSGASQELFSAPGRTADAFGTTESNTWYHVVMTNRYNEDETYEQTCIYDGDIANSLTASAEMMPFSATASMTIGSHVLLTYHMMTGMMDEIAIYDLTGLSQEAYDAKVANIAGHYSAATVAKIPGDANGDRKVDGSDVTILAGNWQVLSGATWDMGDFNSDGKVDGSDVTILAGNWQAGVTTASASVPEPSSLMLLIVLAGSGFVFCRTRKSR